MVNKVYVWDKFVRIFHWSLVALFATSYFTGEEESIWHIYSGYAIVALVLSRVLWGFVGTQHARFADFIYRPSTVFHYACAMLGGKPRHYLGHNPLGGLMIIALLTSLLVTTYSGLKLYAVEKGKGPLAQTSELTLISNAVADDHDKRAKHARNKSQADENFWEDIHETAVNLMLLLIVVHVGGVLISSRIHGESLVKSMISGYKMRQ